MGFFKPGDDPIIHGPTSVDPRHVTTATRRYERHMRPVRNDPDVLQGITTTRWEAEVRKAQVQRIEMESYQVNAPAVAEAILLRLLAGHALPKRAAKE
jgi:hypothetical protein